MICKFIKNSCAVFSDDCLKPVRVIGSSIYQLKIVKRLLKLMLITYSTVLLLQLYYFFQTPNIEDLLKYGPLYLQMCYVIFTKRCYNRIYESISGGLCFHRYFAQKPYCGK
jgi:hypothetical protein